MAELAEPVHHTRENPLVPEVERSLRKLQHAIRAPTEREPPEPILQVGRVPEDVAVELEIDPCEAIGLPMAEHEALENVRALLAEDLRFEYMDDSEREHATLRFVCLVHHRRNVNHVPPFIAEHAHEPERLECFFPVEHLAVTEAITLPSGVRLTPGGEIAVPPIFGPAAVQTPTVDSCLVVECAGTNRTNMSVRAREVARHSLRWLRAALREERELHERQLRFRLGETLWFSDRLSGWQLDAGEGWDYTLEAAALQRAASQAIASLPLHGGTRIERAASRALRWFEQAQLTVDPLNELLFLFFALESILGDDAEGLKGRKIALRRAVLSHRTAGHFRAPFDTYLLYDEVRSTAVHGDEPPIVPERTLVAFAWDVRLALNEVLEFAHAQNLKRRSRVVAALDGDPDAARIAEQFLPPEPD